jgi:hypothetical protein
MIMLEENGTLGRQAAPRPVGLPYLRSLTAPVFGRQASLSFLSLCVQILVPRTTVDIDNLPKLDSSKNPHP